MKPEERAEKMAKVIEKRIPADAIEVPGSAMALRVWLAAQIAEAEREAVDSNMRERAKEYGSLIVKEVYAEGFAAAKAKVAFLAHQWADNVYNGNGEMQLVKWIRELAAQIEALEP